MFCLLVILVISTPLFSDCLQIFLDNATDSGINETVINSGDTLNLKCVGNVPLDWAAPTFNSTDMNEPSSSFSFKSKKEGDKYENILSLSSASYLNTGYYFCHPKGQPNSDETESIYVYVKDENHLLVVNDSVVMITVKQYETLVIPCRPSSPDVNVTLSVGGDIMVPGIEYDGSPLIYDPRFGFSLDYVSDYMGNSYKCSGQLNESISNDVLYDIYILPHTDRVEKPYINATLASHLLLGDTAILDCSVRVDPGIIVTMDWVVPNSDNSQKNHIRIEPVPHEEIDKPTKHVIEHKKLIITNVTLKDAGRYICNVTDHGLNVNQNSYDLQVYRDDTAYLNLSTPLESFQAYGRGQAHSWVVNITSFPQPKPENIAWYHEFSNFKKKIDDEDKEYTIVKKPTESFTKLIIKNLTVHDSGKYHVFVNNGLRNASLTMELIVEDRPEVHLIADDYYLENYWHTVNCSIAGHNVNISWLFRLCSNYEESHLYNYTSCEDDEFHSYPADKYSVIEMDDVYKISTLNIFASRSVILMCMSCNSVGYGCENKTSKFLVSDVRDGFDLSGPTSTVSGDTVVLTCGVSFHKFKDGLIWEHIYQNKSSRFINKKFPGKNAYIDTYETELSLYSNLTLENVNDLTSGVYICRQNKSHGLVKNLTLTVLAPKEPKFVNVSFIDKEETILVDHSLKWDCRANGTPTPEIIWMKDGKKIHEHSHHKPGSKNTNRPHILFSRNNTRIEITKVAKEDAGVYSCVAKNRIKEIKREVSLQVVESAISDTPLLYLYIFLVLVFICAIIIVVLVCRVKKEKELRKQLTADGLLNFEEGAVESLNPDLDVVEQADLLPYNNKFEFPRSKLKLGKQLGSGAFGVVLKGEAEGILEPDVKTTVAVKMVKQNVDVTHIKALVSELKIMIHLGGHINVVNLLGACTSNLNKRELLVIVEYCPFGNLHKFLQQHRDTFINQVNPRTGRFDPTIITSVPKAKYVNVPEFSSTNQSNSNGTVRLGSISEDNRHINSAGSDATTPTVGEDGYLMCRPPEELILSKLHEDRAKQPISTQDLLCWSFQIARGMEYLASRKVLHGDLAARNILLAENNIVKICDFGLSKNMYKDDNYFKKGKRLLPVKWMALEAIRDRNFSIQSDVWAYGIVLWELFSLARTPYPGLEDVELLYRKLEQGYRMEIPQYATQELYEVMMDCWRARPSTRPSFTDLSEKLGDMLQDSVRKHYVDLNDPFLAENAEYLSQRDYLSMLSSPTYANLDRETGESLSNATSGYVTMRQRKRSDAQEETELRPMLSSTSGRNGSLSDVETEPNAPASPSSPTGNFVSVTEAAASHGFSNPTYHNLGRPPINPYMNNPYVS